MKLIGRWIAWALIISFLSEMGCPPTALPVMAAETAPVPGPILFPTAPPAGNLTPIAIPGGGGISEGSAPSMRTLEDSLYASASVQNLNKYVLGPGDRMGVHITIGENALNLDYSFQVSISGQIYFPTVGNVQAAGIPFGKFKSVLRQQIAKKFKDKFTLDVVLEDVRQVRVYLFGYVNSPGPRSVSGLSSLIDLALTTSSTSGGSERFVVLKRAGEANRVIDLYRYRLGDISEDVLVKAGDILEIPRAGDVDRVLGQVNRPGYYEMKPRETVKDLLRFAGGMTKFAVWEQALLMSRNSVKKSDTVSYDTLVADGDLLYVPGRNIKVQIIGEVESPGIFDLYEGQTLRDLIKVSGGIKKTGALQEVVYLSRKVGQDIFEDRKLNAYKLIYENDESQNVILEDGDVVTIPSIALYVYVYGEVQSPGRKPYIPGQKLSDYINDSGGPTDRANLGGVSVSRSEGGDSQVFRVNADEILHRGHKDKDMDLKGGDVVFVPGRFFHFNDFTSLATLIITIGTLYGIFVRR